jgi:putative hemolysin
MRYWSLAVVVALAGCSTVSPVVPTGRDTYMVGSNARGGFTSDAEVKALAINRANEFCAAQGKRAQVLTSSSSGVQMWTPQNAEVHFSCIDR